MKGFQVYVQVYQYRKTDPDDVLQQDNKGLCTYLDPSDTVLKFVFGRSRDPDPFGRARVRLLAIMELGWR